MEKSQDTKKYGNPLKRVFIDRFMRQVTLEVQGFNPSRILDIGCGEGYFTAHLSQQIPAAITGLDIDQAKIERARQRCPQHTFLQADLFSADLSSLKPDLLLAMEVLEHLAAPQQALQRFRELAPAAILTVPQEPWFSLMSLAGGNYVKNLGRHPDHVNAWSTASFHRLLIPYYPSVRIRVSIPWIIAVCEG
ncbi:MAG: class I SAM-dependent methyltransferase [Anaerolineae bacterium]